MIYLQLLVHHCDSHTEAGNTTNALAAFLSRPASCYLNRRFTPGNKKPTSALPTRVIIYHHALAKFIKRLQAEYQIGAVVITLT
jgi:hypothetical protein